MKTIMIDEYQIIKDENGLTFSIGSGELEGLDWETFEAVHHMERKVIVFFRHCAVHISGIPTEWMSLMPFCSTITLQEKTKPESARLLTVNHQPLYQFN